MFDIDTVKNSLQVNTSELSMLATCLLDPHDKNYVWSTINNSVYGLTEIRARTGLCDIPWDPKSVFSIPNLDQPFNKKLFDIFDNRAVEIFNHATRQGKKIVIQWSGGIDSTSIVCAFIKNISQSELQNIIICTTTQGVAENPYFYQTQIHGKFEMLHWTQLDLSDSFFDSHVLLNGDPGDCIFGPSVSKYQSLWDSDQHLKPWNDSMPVLYQLYHAPANLSFSPWYVDMISNNLRDLQQQGLYTNIKSISDWHWWNYYNFKWQGSLTRPLGANKKNAKSKISQRNLEEFFNLCFFAGSDFQIWSYQNLSNLCKNQMQDHKSEAKQYIYELDKNANYLTNKRKEASIVSILKKAPIVVDKDAVHYYPDDDGVIDTFRKLLTA
jgi:hypothetical protein